ncbi:hypothetical protein AT1219_60120 [Vibrio alginolyticus]
MILFVDAIYKGQAADTEELAHTEIIETLCKIGKMLHDGGLPVNRLI